MKKAARFLSIVLVVVMMFSSLNLLAFAKDSGFKQTLQDGVSSVIEKTLSGVFWGLMKIIPDGEGFDELSEHESKNFIRGNDTFLSEPAERASWKLGASSVSLVPDDYLTKDYYLGGYIMLENGFSNKVEGVIDDMKARVIAVEDGSDRGVSVFATIDCIGVTNSDIRQIRELLIKKAGDDFDFSGITVTSTHTHSGIDTEGLWTNLFKKAPLNLFKRMLGIGNLESGTDSEYMQFLYEKVAQTMLDACENMTSGTMTYAVKDISSQYFVNKNRSSASSLITDMNRFVFTPYNGSTPTMIVNVAAHPDVAGLPTSDGQGNGRQVSGDYIYYMGEIINDAGYNFMFFNGAIAGIYMGRGASNDSQTFYARYRQSQRYGYELGRIALSLTLTVDEIKADARLGLTEKIIAEETAIAEANGGAYTLWYKDWTPVTETELAPVFNIRFREVTIEISNYFIAVAGKLNLAAYDVCRQNGKYYIITEIGYMQLGNEVEVVLMPGEVCQDLVGGGASLTAEGSYSGTEFGGKTVREIFGENTIAFGLANDAIGYVIPDNDFCMCIAFDHYQELISLGKGTASTIMSAYEVLKAEINGLYLTLV